MAEEKQVDNSPDPSDFPDGGWKAWSVVLGAWSCLFCSFGWVNSIGLFQTFYQDELFPSYSPSSVAWITSVEVCWTLYIHCTF